jgi:ABC-type Mn2+/Zn2+ transport system ATPase subunit
MIEALISSKTRIKLLLKFFLNSNTTAYLRSLESEFGESTNAIRVELNRFEEAGMLTSFSQGNRKLFRANILHPLFNEVNSILRKQVGIDQIIDGVITRLGDIDRVYVAGALAKGMDSNIIDLVFVGKIDVEYLIRLIDRVENLIHRKIRYVIYSPIDIEVESKLVDESLLIWEKS